METVEILIKIPKKQYDWLMAIGDCSLNHNERAIKHGTLLPKGHGRLCDMDAALECLQETADCKTKQYAIGMLDWAMSKRTIIGADKDGD